MPLVFSMVLSCELFLKCFSPLILSKKINILNESTSKINGSEKKVYLLSGIGLNTTRSTFKIDFLKQQT